MHEDHPPFSRESCTYCNQFNVECMCVYVKLCVADFETKDDQTEWSRNAKPRHNPRGGFARRRKKAEEARCQVASGICNQHSRGSSDVTSGHLPNKQKPRNRTLSAGNDFEKEGAIDAKHVSRETNKEAR
ncbi:unnamed protein product [Xylocopa violacea]|uniref:Uncharacterized protein n=1 Tax=Xylocopa violacea TaxID=135666 RepID=A0ABP1NUD2_XYLVO